MGDDRAELLPARDLGERTAGLGYGDELVGPRARREIVTERERLDRVAGLAGDDEERPRQVRTLCRGAHSLGIGAVQNPQAPDPERLREHIGNETRTTHATDEGAGEPVGS